MAKNVKKKPQKIKFTYLGTLGGTNHIQEESKVIITGIDAGEPVRIKIFKKGNLSQMYYDSGGITVNIGDTIMADATGVSSGDKFASETEISVYREVNLDDSDDGSGLILVHTIIFHTSCSQPIRLGDVFGSMMITEMHYDDPSIPSDILWTLVYIKTVNNQSIDDIYYPMGYLLSAGQIIRVCNVESNWQIISTSGIGGSHGVHSHDVSYKEIFWNQNNFYNNYTREPSEKPGKMTNTYRSEPDIDVYTWKVDKSTVTYSDRKDPILISPIPLDFDNTKTTELDLHFIVINADVSGTNVKWKVEYDMKGNSALNSGSFSGTSTSELEIADANNDTLRHYVTTIEIDSSLFNPQDWSVFHFTRVVSSHSEYNYAVYLSAVTFRYNK